MARTSVYRLGLGNPVAKHCSMLEKSQLIMWKVTSVVRQYWSAPAAIRVMANETNNATVTGLITLAKGCFMFRGPVRVVDHEYRASKTTTRVTLQA
jgi:hypothetical protein